MPSLTIPHEATIRTYQKKLWECLYQKKRGFFFIHRRAGKDFVCVNILLREAINRVGVYYYLFPTYEQARKVIWEGITNDGRKFIDMFPSELVAKRNEQQMSIELVNGSVIRLIGTDRYDAIRGTNPVGCVFSEFAFQNPMAWDIIRPILRANDGWAIFISTPNAENHAWELYTRVKDNENWVTQLLTIDDTYALTKEDLEEERLSGMSEAMIRQEYYCDPFALQDGVVYGKEIKMLGDRVGDVAYDPLLPVQTFWDLGRSDQAVIWFVQLRGDRINLIDYHENTGEWVGDWITLLKEKKYSYMPLGLPHDAFAKRNEAKHSIAGQFEEAGFPVKKVQLTSIQNGISAVRRIFPRLHFDKTRCNQGLTMLKSYSYEYDQTLKKFKNSPKHDVYSHACLTGDTRILTTRGDVSIKNIKEGEKVALDGIEATVVCAKQTGRKEVYTLEFESGHKIESTQDHKFFTTRGLVRAGDLRYNDTVHTLTKPLWRLLDFKSIGIKEGIISNTKELNTEYGHEGDRLLKITYKGFEEVYDLTVEKHHAYYANGILVSNSDALRYLAVGIEELAKEENYDKMAQEYINPKPKFDELGVKADEYRDYEKSLKQFLYD